MEDNQVKILSYKEFNEIFELYFSAIRNFIYFKVGDAKTAEDLAQDTFVKLWETRSAIKKSTVKSYLYTIGGNLTINYLKRNQLNFKFKNQLQINNNLKDPEYLLEMKEYEEKLNNVLSQIPEGSREVFLMNRIEGLKYKEIAENLGLSVKAIEKRISKALEIIREKLGVNL